MTFDPSESLDQSIFGFGPFTGVLDLTAPHPVNSGYGGIGFIVEDGGIYGISSYGSINLGTVIPAVDGGYGGYPYGEGPYGSTDVTPPQMSSAVSLDGYRIEIFFSGEMAENTALLDPASYTLTPTTGAPSTVTAVEVSTRDTADPVSGDYVGGVLSAIITHTGTTLGGTYVISTTGLEDIAGNPLIGTASLFTLGEPPTATITPLSGNELVVQFSHDMLTAAEIPPGGNSLSDAASYEFTSSYPLDLVALSATHPYGGDDAKALVVVQGMTTVQYEAILGPASVVDYDGTIFPNGSADWHGVELGTGTSRIYGNHLRLDRAAGVPYGWEFLDLSGRLMVDTTVRIDLTIDASAAAFTPGGLTSTEVFELAFQDAAPGAGVRARVTLQKDIGGNDAVRLRSGVYDQTFAADWSSGPKTITLVRNQKAGIYSLLIDDTVITSTLLANFTGVSTGSPGASFFLVSGAWSVTDFEVQGFVVSASTTLFSDAWNFLHDVTTYFTGSGALTRQTLLTRRGPLVKGWGDATPATKQDVTVRVAGVEVEVTEVNPYIGQITLAIPVPLLPPGTADVEVDYQWFATPTFEFAASDTPGLVLDQYDLPAQAGGSATPSAQDGALGAANTARFPFSALAGPLERPQPKYISHRYLGFQREYSAVSDSPTTLLMDMAPGRTAVPGFELITQGASVAFEANDVPTAGGAPWTLTGTDYGQVNVGLGTYTTIDAKTGTYDPNDPQTVVYDRSFTVFPAEQNMVVRLTSAEGSLFDSTPSGADTDTATPDGVFTGIGFGFHNGLSMALVGLLKVNGVYHVGLLQNAEEPHLAASWDIGPKATATLSAQDTSTIQTTDAPVGLEVGTRFQVLTGLQAGVYTVESVVTQTTGVTTLTFSPNMPTAWDTYGAKYPVLSFEVRHTANPFTYRITKDIDDGFVAEVSGEIRGIISTPSSLPNPADTSLLIPAEQGHYFWGSLSRSAASKATWNFVRYGIVPPGSTMYAQDVSSNTEMDLLPELDVDDPWFPTANFGTAEVQTPVNILLLRATSADETRNFTRGYGRTENFLTPDAIFDYRAKFRLDDGVLGSSDLVLMAEDGEKHARLVTLLYREAVTGDNTTYRRLIDLPQVSIPGILNPVDEGWDEDGVTTGVVRGSYLEVTLDAATGSGGQYGHLLDTSNIDFTDSYGRTLQGTVRVDSWDTQPGVMLGAYLPDGTPNGKTILLVLSAGGNVLIGDGTGTVAAYAFDWDDKEFHTYRAVVDVLADTVSIVIDDVVQIPTLALSGFAAGTGNDGCLFGSIALGGSSVASWHSVSYQVHPPIDAKRTLGVWKGGDLGDINSYEVPRTDNSTAPNSWELGPTQPGMDPGPAVEEMDWRVDTEVRFYRDPEWGVSIFRPDLAPPPYYQAEDGMAGKGYITDSVEPSAAWINVEYSQLPEAERDYAVVAFGALAPQSVTQQRWTYVRYRIFRSPEEDRTAPYHMVLDQYNVIHSGELGTDRTLEQVVVETVSKKALSLLPTHIYAAYVYQVVDGSTIYTPDQFSFDSDTQILTLLEDQETATAREFSAQFATVTVTFTPGKPVTNTYLAGQPLRAGVTLLNEQTPPYPKSQIGVSTLVDGVSTPVSPYNTSYHQEQPGTLYDDLEFIEVEDGGETGLIKSICEGQLSPNTEVWDESLGDLIYSPTGGGAPLGGAGGSAGLFETGDKVGAPQGGFNIAFGGTSYWEKVGSPKDTLYDQQAGQNYLLASGGNFIGPVVDALGIVTDIQCLGGNANEALVYPGGASGGAAPGTAAVWNEVEWHMNDFHEEVDVLGADDTVPPTEPPGWYSNPDGTPGADGSALLVLRYTLLSPAPGPWGGDPGLLPVPEYGLFGVTAPVPGTLLELWDTVSGLLATFLAVAGPPVAPGDWSVTVGLPLTNLMVAINTHPVASTLVVAEAGVDDVGVWTVTVKPLIPPILPDYYWLTTSNPVETHIGVALTVA